MAEQVRIRSDKDTNFTTAIAAGAKEDENLTGLQNHQIKITSIAVQSENNYAWDIQFWGTDGFDSTDLDADYFQSAVSFAKTDGGRIGGAGQYYYSKTDLFIPYFDRDATNELHISLCNRASTAKTATGTGEVVVEITYEWE